MSLAIVSEKGISFEDIRTATNIAVYLGDFVDFIGGVPHGERNAAANAYIKSNPLKTNNKAKAAELVGKMETEYKNEAENASLQTKMRYKFGAENAAKIKKVTALGAASVVGCVLAANGMTAVSVPVLFAGLVAAADDRKMSDKDKADVAKYAEAKHALFALKKMKKMLSPKSANNKLGIAAALGLKQKSR